MNTTFLKNCTGCSFPCHLNGNWSFKLYNGHKSLLKSHNKIVKMLTPSSGIHESSSMFNLWAKCESTLLNESAAEDHKTSLNYLFHKLNWLDSLKFNSLTQWSGCRFGPPTRGEDYLWILTKISVYSAHKAIIWPWLCVCVLFFSKTTD